MTCIPARWSGAMRPLLCLAAAAVLLPACSCAGGRAAPVDPSRAQNALTTALESWKKGEAIAALKSADPSIVAQDFDWMAGYKLLNYELAGDARDDDANLRIPVKLTLRSPEGKEVQKKVSYVVGTSPTLTVFRDFQ